MTLRNPSPEGTGKVVADKRNLHIDSLPQHSGIREIEKLLARLCKAEFLAGCVGVSSSTWFGWIQPATRWGCCTIRIFWDEPSPRLVASWRVDLDAGSVSHRTYADSLNPPRHRKELLLAEDDRRRELYAALTAARESIGLFDDPRRIGYRHQWDHLVRERGYRIVGLALEPLGNDDGGSGDPDTGADRDNGLEGWQAARHRTALNRYGFSAPIQWLAHI